MEPLLAYLQEWSSTQLSHEQVKTLLGMAEQVRVIKDLKMDRTDTVKWVEALRTQFAEVYTSRNSTERFVITICSLFNISFNISFSFLFSFFTPSSEFYTIE